MTYCIFLKFDEIWWNLCKQVSSHSGNYMNYAVLTLYQERCQDLIYSHQEGLKCSIGQSSTSSERKSGIREKSKVSHTVLLVYVCKQAKLAGNSRRTPRCISYWKSGWFCCHLSLQPKTPKFLTLDTPLGTTISGGYTFQFLPCTAVFFRKHVRHDWVF